MTRPQYLLTVDLGSGGPKVALVSDAGELVAAVRGTVRTFFCEGGGVEQDADEWWEVISGLARELIGRRLVPVDDIIAICSACQWSVIVPVDATGKTLGRAISWLDARGAPHARHLMRGWVKVSGYGAWRLWRWLRYTAAAPTLTGADSLSHLLYLKQDRPEVYRQAASFLEPADFLGLRLSGRVGASYASIFPYLLTDNRDAHRVRYADELLRLSGIDRAKLPELLPVNTVLGPILAEVADDWGLSRGTQVVIGQPDSQTALLGSGAVQPFEAHLCVGTSSWLSCLVPQRRVRLLESITSMPSSVPGQYMLAAEQGVAGKCLETFVERWFQGLRPDARGAGGEGQAAELAVRDAYATLLGEASEIPAGSGGVMFLPWLNGSGPPSQDGQVRGAFLNLSLQASRAHAVRAVLEGVALNLRWLSGAVEGIIGRPIRELNFIGGGAQSELWSQILADVLGCRIRQMVDPQWAIVRGAAFAGLMALGRVQLAELRGKVRVQRTFEPDLTRRKVYDTLFAEFLRAHRGQRGLGRRLAALRDPADGTQGATS